MKKGDKIAAEVVLLWQVVLLKWCLAIGGRSLIQSKSSVQNIYQATNHIVQEDHNKAKGSDAHWPSYTLNVLKKILVILLRQVSKKCFSNAGQPR